MSANPLLDALRASIPEGGKLTLDALNSFIGSAIASSGNFFGFDKSTGQVKSYKSTVFYSARGAGSL
jgi:hypothetical protein